MLYYKTIVDVVRAVQRREAPPAELINLYDWEDPGRCGACTRRILCSRGCYSERLLVPHTSACDSWERVVGERIISLNFQSDDVMDMLPVL
ncbi:MAG: hypothetical protein K6U03_03165 [Firmicutes bacterium]|nr:hypothetical protein [Bacillota bacterium]